FYATTRIAATTVICLVRVTVAAHAARPSDEHQPLAVHDLERLHVRVAGLPRHLRHRGVEPPHHGALHLLLAAGERAPNSGARAEGLAVLLQLLGRVAFGIHADREQPDVAALLRRNQPVLDALHLRLQPWTGVRAG